MKSQFLIGAAASGCGKTTLTLGLLRAFRNRGLHVQPFKCGPDYIDTQFHKVAASADSINLDPFFSSDSHLRHLYANAGTPAQVCVAEGAMGLLDGYKGREGSNASIAQLIGLPVLLVVDARATAYSVAPLLDGYQHFCRDLTFAGVVFNRVATPHHAAALQQACADTGMACLGCLPYCEGLAIPSRHLGLTLQKRDMLDQLADQAAQWVQKDMDIDRLLAMTARPFPFSPWTAAPRITPRIRIAVAKDEAFNFIYKQNITQLERYGDITYFSPLNDPYLPSTDFVYLPGGYPEFYIEKLSNNRSMLHSVHSYCETGGKLFAECGGMMYLCRSLCDMTGKTYPLAGVLPQDTSMQPMRLRLGYRQFIYHGTLYRGHEFHYSALIPPADPRDSIVQMYNTEGKKVETALWRYKNVIAGYTHLYWGETDLMHLWNN